MTDNTGIGGAIGTMIGLGIGIAVAKKLTDEIKDSPSKKKVKNKEIKSNWVSKETGVWN